MIFGVNDAKKWVQKINEKMQENKQQLTKLDQAIGDGDHGINMARGFNEAQNIVEKKEYSSVADVFKDVAMTVMSKVSGAAGPLYGSAFLRLSLSLKGKDQVSYADFAKGLEAALAGMKQRGKAEAGEKTLVDVWERVVEHLKKTDYPESEQLTAVAKSAMEKTKETMATKGRAAYFKEKSIGHIDPGAMSSYYLFAALSEVWKEA